MARIIGIDLGTTNSVVAVLDNKEPKVIINEEGSRITPSVVGFSKKSDRFVGEVAKRQMVINPENTIHSIKRFMGRRYDEARLDAELVNFKLTRTSRGSIAVEVNTRLYSPQELSAMILSRLKKSAEEFLGEKITDAVITVPAYFSDNQRQATRDAGTIAGLNVVRIINEPTAAALAYMMNRKGNATIAVYDFGGGTFDISIVEITDQTAQVKATSGNSRLGGDDIDQRIMDWLTKGFFEEHHIDIRSDRMAMQRLKDAAERAKMELSTALETEIHLPFLTADESGPKHIHRTLRRADFESMIEDLLQLTLAECRKVLGEARMLPGDIQEVVLVGGSSRIPRVQELVRGLFGRNINKSFNPDEVVAVGASIQGAMLGGNLQDVQLLDVTSMSLGIEIEGGKFAPVIPKNTTIPCRTRKVVSTISDFQTTVKVHVLQGEDTEAHRNVSLGEFELTGVPAAPRGVARVEISFSIDADGVVNVRAREKKTGINQGLVIRSFAGLTQKEVAALQQEHQKQEEDSAMTREVRRLRNALERQVFDLEKFLNTHRERLSKNDAREIDAALKRGRMALFKSNGRAEYFQEIYDYIYHFYTSLSARIGV
ncbi:MAG: molecular chaperone DnaK [Myxococcota bacterium]